MIKYKEYAEVGVRVKESSHSDLNSRFLRRWTRQYPDGRKIKYAQWTFFRKKNVDLSSMFTPEIVKFIRENAVSD